MFYFKLLCISNWSVNSLTLSKNWWEKREAQSQTSGHCVMLQIFLFNSNTTFDLMLIQNVKNDVGFIGHYLCFTASQQTSLYGKHYSLIWAVDAYGSFFFWQMLCHPWQADLWSSSQDVFFFFLLQLFLPSIFWHLVPVIYAKPALVLPLWSWTMMWIDSLCKYCKNGGWDKRSTGQRGVKRPTGKKKKKWKSCSNNIMMNVVRNIFLYLKIIRKYKENTDNLKTVRTELLKGMFLLIYKVFVKQYYGGLCVIICPSWRHSFLK